MVSSAEGARCFTKPPIFTGRALTCKSKAELWKKALNCPSVLRKYTFLLVCVSSMLNLHQRIISNLEVFSTKMILARASVIGHVTFLCLISFYMQTSSSSVEISQITANGNAISIHHESWWEWSKGLVTIYKRVHKCVYKTCTSKFGTTRSICLSSTNYLL